MVTDVCLSSPKSATLPSHGAPPWSAEEMPARFIVRDHSGQKPDTSIMKKSLADGRPLRLLSKDEARGVRRTWRSCRLALMISRGCENIAVYVGVLSKSVVSFLNHSLSREGSVDERRVMETYRLRKFSPKPRKWSCPIRFW